MEINHEVYWVSGVLGGVTDSSLANAAFLPLTTAMDRLSGPLLADRLYVRCRTWDDVSRVATAIPAVVRSHHPPKNFNVEVSWEGLKRVQRWPGGSSLWSTWPSAPPSSWGAWASGMS